MRLSREQEFLTGAEERRFVFLWNKTQRANERFLRFQEMLETDAQQRRESYRAIMTVAEIKIRENLS